MSLEDAQEMANLQRALTGLAQEIVESGKPERLNEYNRIYSIGLLSGKDKPTAKDYSETLGAIQELLRSVRDEPAAAQRLLEAIQGKATPNFLIRLGLLFDGKSWKEAGEIAGRNNPKRRRDEIDVAREQLQGTERANQMLEILKERAKRFEEQEP